MSDEWQFFLCKHDIDEPEHDARHTKVEALMWDVAERLLRAHVDGILDFASGQSPSAMRSGAGRMPWGRSQPSTTWTFRSR